LKSLTAVQKEDLLDMDTFIRVLPKKCKTTVSKAVVDEINRAITSDSELRDIYRENLLGYSDVMKEGRYKIKDYLAAVRYVSYKLMGNNNTIAYTKTFPERYQRLVSQKAAPKDISAYACTYNKNKLVNLVFAQTLTPTHVLNADIHQEAINCQAALMRDPGVSDKVRSDAATSLLVHLKPPEGKMELDVAAASSDDLNELREITRLLAATQLKYMQDGTLNAKQVAESRIVKEVPA
jgi:hypothetical protein